VSAQTFHHLREWLRLEDAAAELSAAMSDRVSEAEVLRLAIDSHLKLSLYLPAKVNASCKPATDESLAPQVRDRLIEGLWDLPMIAPAKAQIEHYYQHAEGVYVPLPKPVGALVQNDESVCRLPPEPGAGGMWPVPASEFPRGSVLAVRRTVLEEFIAHHQPTGVTKPEVLDKPLQERERSTLLTMIAALAKRAGVDISKPSQAAAAIEAMTEVLGARVSARCIEDHLKRIPDAIERKKTST
jgi:hypothetical protein